MIESALFSLLNNTSTLTAIVGDKIFLDVAPQDRKYPLVVYARANTEPTITKEVTSSLDVIRFQIDAYSETPEQALNITNAIRVEIEGYSGTLEGQTIQSIRFIDQRNGNFEGPVGYYRVISEYNIRHAR